MSAASSLPPPPGGAPPSSVATNGYVPYSHNSHAQAWHGGSTRPMSSGSGSSGRTYDHIQDLRARAQAILDKEAELHVPVSILTWIFKRIPALIVFSRNR
jgi:hypothetical protein